MAQFTADELADQAGVRNLDQECTNDDFLHLHKFCDPWELNGQHLKLTPSQISAVDGDYRTIDQKRLGVLQKWKETFAHKATYRVLITALLACGKAEQALEVCKILAQEQDTVIVGDLRIFTRTIDVLGEGSFGIVFKGRWRQKACAAKVLTPLGQKVLLGIPITQQMLIPEDMLQKFRRECEFMKDFRHPKIVAYYDTLLYPRCNLPVLVMELMQTSLSQYITDKGAVMLLKIQISLSRDIASALEFLHDRNLTHRDLCSDNVLVNYDQHIPVAKVSDFGISRMQRQQSHSLTSLGYRSGYLPRELFSYLTDYDASLDIFMFGVIMTLIAQKVPNVKTMLERQKLVAQVGQHPLKSCIDQCLTANNEERSNAGKLHTDLSSLLRSLSTSSACSTTEKPTIAKDDGLQLVDTQKQKEQLPQTEKATTAMKDQEEELLLQLSGSQSNIQLTESSLTSLKEENKSLITKVGELEGTVKKLDQELEEENKSLTIKVAELEGTVKKLNQELEEEREKEETAIGADTLTRIEVAYLLRERNEYKEKYLALLEQIRMSDELSLFKSKPKKSRWVDYFAALFNPAEHRQMETQDSTTRRPPILGRNSPGRELDEVNRGVPLAVAAGYHNTGVIPVLRKTGRKQDELYMTSISWVIPALMEHHGSSSSGAAGAPNINTCRPMTYQEDDAKVLCAAAVNPVMFMEDNRNAVAVLKNPTPVPDSKPDNFSTSLVWVVSGVTSLTKVSVIDAAAMGEALVTFTVCASPIHCIATVPGFNENDPDVLTSLSNARKKSVPAEFQNAQFDRPSSKFSTMWMGSETGELYVHSAVSMWKIVIHADKLPAAIQDIIYMKGKVFIFLGNTNLAVFRRFPDGDWDWYNYSLVVLETSQRRDFKCTVLAAVHFNVWCAVGNLIHVVHSHLLKKESTFSAHHSKKAEVSHMVPVGDGVWISFKFDSTLRLFHGTTLTCMQDLDIGPSFQRVLAFGNERRMPIQVSTLIPAHNALWVGTENGVLLSFPFTVPTMVAEEAGWKFIKEAEVGGTAVPEPFDVRTEHAIEARALNFEEAAEVGTELEVPDGGGRRSNRSSESPLPPSVGATAAPKQQPKEKLKQMEAADVPKKMFNPFCSVDGMQLSIHCHINAVKTLVCAPGQVAKDTTIFEPLGGVVIGTEDRAQMKPALFVISCGEGHLDLRTADKVMQTLLAKDSGESGLPSPATIISEKNYIIVWEISS